MIIFWVLLLAFISAVLFHRYRHRSIRRFTTQPALQDALNTLSEVYAPYNPFEISKAAREQAKLYDNAFVYGEIDPISFAAVLSQIHLKPHEIFYDLGSGSGKAVLLTALLYPESRAIGIEFLTEFIDLSELCRQKIQCNNAQFIHGDYFNIDFSSADIVFVNATGLFGDDLVKLRQRLDCVKPGTRIIITSKRLNPQFFEELYAGQVEMSWGPCSLNIYQKY